MSADTKEVRECHYTAVDNAPGSEAAGKWPRPPRYLGWTISLETFLASGVSPFCVTHPPSVPAIQWRSPQLASLFPSHQSFGVWTPAASPLLPPRYSPLSCKLLVLLPPCAEGTLHTPPASECPLTARSHTFNTALRGHKRALTIDFTRVRNGRNHQKVSSAESVYTLTQL